MTNKKIAKVVLRTSPGSEGAALGAGAGSVAGTMPGTGNETDFSDWGNRSSDFMKHEREGEEREGEGHASSSPAKYVRYPRLGTPQVRQLPLPSPLSPPSLVIYGHFFFSH